MFNVYLILSSTYVCVCKSKYVCVSAYFYIRLSMYMFVYIVWMFTKLMATDMYDNQKKEEKTDTNPFH